MSEFQSLSNLVDKRLKEAQSSKEFKDSEKRVYGTRKELMALKMIRLSDLASLEENEELAQALVKKDKVFPKFNVEAEVDKGSSGGASYLKYRLRELYPSKSNNDKLLRMIYVGMVDIIIREFWDELTIDDLKNKISSFNPFLALAEVIYPNDFEDIKAEYNQKVKAKKKLEDWVNQEKINYVGKENLVYLGAKYQKEIELGLVGYQATKAFELFGEQGYGYLNPEMSYFSYTEKLALTIFELLFGKKMAQLFVRKRFYDFKSMFELALKYDPYTQEDFDKSYEKRQLERLEKQLTEIDDFLSKYFRLSSREYGIEYFNALSVESAIYYVGFYNEQDRKHVSLNDLKKLGYPPSLYDFWIKRALDYFDNRKNTIKEEITALKEKTTIHGNLYTFAKREKKEDGAVKERSEIIVNKGAPLSYIKRTGGYEIKDEDVNVQTIEDKFGFASVTFGNYVKDQEAREHIRHFLGAVSDLGELLNMDLRQLNKLHSKNKLGGLSMWFGAGGRGGSASAFYNGTGCVINITKSRGDGTVAHEYAHYLDNAVLAQKDNNEYDLSNDNRAYASTTREAKKGKYYNPLKSPRYYENSSLRQLGDLAEYFVNIMDFIYTCKVPYWVRQQNTDLNDEWQKLSDNKIKVVIKAQSKEKYKLREKYEGETIDEYLSSMQRIYPQLKQYELLTSRNEKILGFILNKFQIEEKEMEFSVSTTQFFANSDAMSSDYWSRPWELFARGFECFIYDLLESKQRANNYLVSGTYFDHPSGVYPAGLERKVLFLLYKRLVEKIKDKFNIADFAPIRDVKVDEYVKFEDNTSTEVVEAGIVTEEDSKKVLSEIETTNELPKKFEKLLAILMPKEKEAVSLTLEQRMNEAYKQGQIAEKKDKERTPAKDKDLQPFLKGISKPKEYSQIVEQWTKGWDDSRVEKMNRGLDALNQ